MLFGSSKCINDRLLTFRLSLLDDKHASFKALPLPECQIVYSATVMCNTVPRLKGGWEIAEMSGGILAFALSLQCPRTTRTLQLFKAKTAAQWKQNRLRWELAVLFYRMNVPAQQGFTGHMDLGTVITNFYWTIHLYCAVQIGFQSDC